MRDAMKIARSSGWGRACALGLALGLGWACAPQTESGAGAAEAPDAGAAAGDEPGLEVSLDAPTPLETETPPEADAPPAAANATPIESDLGLVRLLKPDMEAEVGLDPYLAPLLYIEEGEHARLLDDTVWFQDSGLVRGDHELRQLSFAWARILPSGELAVQALRMTCDREGYPALYEVLSGPHGAPAQWTVESLAQAQPLPGASLVARIADGPAPMGPYVYLEAASADVQRLHCRCSPSHFDTLAGDRTYALVPWDEASAPFELELPAPERALMLFALPAEF